jgi:hypothetical protein
MILGTNIRTFGARAREKLFKVGAEFSKVGGRGGGIGGANGTLLGPRTVSYTALPAKATAPPDIKATISIPWVFLFDPILVIFIQHKKRWHALFAGLIGVAGLAVSVGL